MSAPVRDIIKKCTDVAFRDSFKDSFARMFKYKTIRSGRYVGCDQFGNKYYEAPQEGMELRRRWVEMAGPKSEINASNVPPEWHTWMTYVDTHTPIEKIKYEKQPFMLQYGPGMGPTTNSRMGQEANFVPSNYYCPPVDVQPVKYATQTYSTWNPTRGPKDV